MVEIVQHETLAEALLHAQSEYPPLDKGTTVKVTMKAGGSYSYNYADLAYTKHMTDPYLWKHGLVVNGKTEWRDGKEFQIDKLTHVTSKEFEISEIEITEGGDMKQLGGNSTFAKRYNYCNLTGRVGEDDSEPRPVERQNKPQEPRRQPEPGKGTGSAGGGEGKPAGGIGDVKNRLIALESSKKADGMSQDQVLALRVEKLGDNTLNHDAGKLTAYGDALVLAGSAEDNDLDKLPDTPEG